jgi:lysophospholipase L1-like esterase
MLAMPALSGEESEFHIYDGFVSTTYEENVATMVAILHKHNVRVLLMTRPTVLRRGMTAQDLKTQKVFFPYYAEAYSVPRLLSLHNAYNNSIRRLGEKMRVPIVDLDDIFNQQDKRALFWDTLHPSKKGHELIAEALAPRVSAILP